MRQPARPVLDHHEHVQHPERRNYGNEEVTSNDRLGVVTQKCRPALIAARMTRWPPGHVLSDCPWRNSYTQFQQQLIGNALLAPQRILARHTPNELPQLKRNGRPARSRFVTPEQSPAGSMPANHRMWLNDNHAPSLVAQPREPSEA